MESSKVKQELFDVNNENLQKLASLFPSAVKDGQLDIDALKEELGQFEEVGQEKYELTWAGKQNAKKEARRNVLGKTLRYIEGDGVDEDTTQNLYIEGDNLEVLKLLRKNYYGKIKMIYIDPPYNTGNDFVYNDNFSITQEELEQMQGERDEYNERLQKNTKDSARYHTNWLNMMYPRLQLAKDLLTDDGVILISIDDIEIVNLKKVCDCIFGEHNFIASLVWEKKKKGSFLSKHYINMKEYVVVYAKNTNSFGGLIGEINESSETYPCIKTTNARGIRTIKKGTISKYKELNYHLDAGTRISSGNMELIYLTDLNIENGILVNDVDIDSNWIYTQESLNEFANKGLLYITQDLYIRRIVDEDRIKKMRDLLLRVGNDGISSSNFIYSNNLNNSGWGTNEDANDELHQLFGVQYSFDFSKPSKLIAKLLQAIDDKNGIILDFFSGSATTMDACFQLNSNDGGKRKCICVQIPESLDRQNVEQNVAHKFLQEIQKPTNICELGKERIRRAGNKIKEEIEAENQQLKLGEEPKKVPDIGFKVFRVGETTLNWEKLNLQGKDIYHDYIAGTSEKDKLDFTPDFKNDLNVVYEIMLRQEGLPLTSKIEKLTDIGSRTYLVADSYLISLEEDITPEMVEKLSTLNPLPIKFVFRDSAFDDNIVFKDETFRRLNALIDKNTSDEKKTYTVEFI